MLSIRHVALLGARTNNKKWRKGYCQILDTLTFYFVYILNYNLFVDYLK